MRGSDVNVDYMVVVCDFAIVKNGRVKNAVLTAANATHDRIVMDCLLLSKQQSYFEVLFEVFITVSF